MKTLHKFILKSYFGPFIMTFCISLFILLMQFLFKYIDDLVGKGLGWFVITKLMVYAAATLVTLALPLTILLSSIMTFGNLGENYELVALKSAGMSLRKIMFPLVVTAVIISGGAFFFANNVIPYVNLKIGVLLYDIHESKPALNIKAGTFYNGINGYSIRIGSKDPDGVTLHNIMIYDHTQNLGNTRVVLAKSGKMQMTTDKRYLVVTLNNGNSYEEMLATSKNRVTHPMVYNHFKHQILYLNLTGFKLEHTDEALFKGNYQMLNMNQLSHSIDSLKKRQVSEKIRFYKEIKGNYYNRVDKYFKSKKDTAGLTTVSPMALLSQYSKAEQIKIVGTASNIARSAKTYIESSIQDFDSDHDSLLRHEIEWHKKLTFSFACLVLFFIGAPLGAIIRKGGLGMPTVVSILFFVLFWVLSIIGEKFAQEGVLPVYQGMWLASVVLLPIGIFLTYKATVDSALFDVDAYIAPIRRFFISKKKQAKPQ